MSEAYARRVRRLGPQGQHLRHSARSTICDAAVEALRVHHACARTLRAGRARRRGPSASDLGCDPPARARHRRTLPLADAGDVAGGDSPARATKDGGEHLRLAPRTRATGGRTRAETILAFSSLLKSSPSSFRTARKRRSEIQKHAQINVSGFGVRAGACHRAGPKRAGPVERAPE